MSGPADPGDPPARGSGDRHSRPSGPFGIRERGDDPPPRRDAPQPPPAQPPPRRSTVTWILGVAVVFAIAYITLNTLRTEAPGSRGLQPGDRMPPFAAPLALSELDGDANLATKPDQGGQGKRPACEVRGADILNSCELAERGPVALAFVATRSKACDRQVDALDRVRADYPRISFAAVAIRGDRDDLRDVIRRRGWRLPVGWDRDGGVANAYAVAVCPTVTFAYEGGRVEGTALSLIDGAALRARLDKLEAGAP